MHPEYDFDDCETTNVVEFPLPIRVRRLALEIKVNEEHERHAEKTDEEGNGMMCLCDAERDFEKTPKSIIDTLSIDMLVRTANCVHAQPWLLNKLADSYWKEVRAAVANNPKTLIYTLLKLAYDFDDDVRYQLAENKNSPLQVLQILQKDENPFISYRADLTMCRRQVFT